MSLVSKTMRSMRSTHLFPLCLFALVSVAQAREGPPAFGPENPEGLLASPNPEIRHAWKRRVFWRTAANPAQGYTKTPAPTPAERQQMAAQLDGLLALFKATPTGLLGEGFWVNESRTLGGIDTTELPAGIPAARFPHQYASGLFPFYHEDIQTRGGWSLSRAGETESVFYYFNRLPGRLGQTVVASEARGGDFVPIDFYVRPRVTATYNNLPIFENQVLLVTRPGRDPWVAVPIARVLKAAMPLYEKDVAGAEARLTRLKQKNEAVQAPAYEQQMRDTFEKTNGSLRTSRPSNYAARLAAMEHELAYDRRRVAEEANPQRDAKGAWYWNAVDARTAATQLLTSLTPATANGPVCYDAPIGKSPDGRYAIRGNILPAGGSPSCREIVMSNWDYFDLELPRTAPQILGIFDFGRCAEVADGAIRARPVNRWDAPLQGCYKHADMWRELNWTQFAALVRP